MSADKINWYMVERLALKSFTGGVLTQEETSLMGRAWRHAPAEYKKVCERVREEERQRLRSGLG
jgi:hypothetical protein